MKKFKITTIVGTRPELIRLSETIKKLDLYTSHRLIHTGQNASSQLKDVFFSDLGIRNPDVQIELKGSSLGENLGQILIDSEKEFLNHRPDALVVLGDTNSALSVIIAKRMHIPVYHLEAGNRSFDLNVPEEINRKLIDHSSDFNLVYTEHARRNLIAEGLHPRFISLIGSPMKEVIDKNFNQIVGADILKKINLESKKYFVFSSHRQENIDNPARFTKMIQVLNEIANHYKLPIFVTTHPRTRSKLGNLNLEINPLIMFHDPVGFHDFCNLQLNALLTISDSGSISEEASILGFKAVTFRDSMERPEALDSGSILMSGINSESLLQAIDFKLDSPDLPAIPSEYEITDSSFRTLNFIFSTLQNYHFWTGIRQ